MMWAVRAVLDLFLGFLLATAISFGVAVVLGLIFTSLVWLDETPAISTAFRYLAVSAVIIGAYRAGAWILRYAVVRPSDEGEYGPKGVKERGFSPTDGYPNSQRIRPSTYVRVAPRYLLCSVLGVLTSSALISSLLQPGKFLTGFLVLAIPAVAGTIQSFRHMEYLDELVSVSRPLCQYPINEATLEAYWALSESARSGDVSAQFDLAFMYLTGLGVVQDFVPACAWFTRAAAGEGRVADAAKKMSLYL